MAHVMKSSRGAIGGLTRHFERAKNEQGEFLKFSNQEIDTSKSHLNFNLAPKQNQLEFIKKRCGEVKMQNRKDVNVMASWVITAPKSLPAEENKRFFQESYNFLKKRYGEQNIISAHVHMDESTPHMHYAFVPVAFDPLRGVEHVSAKKVLKRADLTSFHGELENHLEKSFGRKVGILNSATLEGNLDVKKLKAIQLGKELKSLQNSLNFASEGYSKLSEDVSKLESEKKQLNKQVKTLQAKIKAVKGTSKVLSVLNKIKPEKTITGALKNITLEQVDDLKKTAIDNIYKFNNMVENYNQLLKSENWYKERYPEKEKNALELFKDNRVLKIKLENYEKAFKKLPPEIREEILKQELKKQPSKSHEIER